MAHHLIYGHLKGLKQRKVVTYLSSSVFLLFTHNIWGILKILHNILEERSYKMWKPQVGEICKAFCNFKAMGWRKKECLKERKYQNGNLGRKSNMEKYLF